MIILLCKAVVKVFPARSVCIAPRMRAYRHMFTTQDVLTGRLRAHDPFVSPCQCLSERVLHSSTTGHDVLAEYQLQRFPSIAHTPVNDAEVESPCCLQSCNRLVTSARNINQERGTKQSLKSEKQSSKASETLL